MPPASTDPLDAGLLNAACRFHRLPWRVCVLPEAASTNDWLRDFGRDHDPVHKVVFAESQTAGRGRRNHAWDSTAGQDLAFSLACRPDLPLHLWTRSTQAAALAVCRAIEAETPLKAAIKWPNDILIDGKKISGILTESFTGNGGRFLVIGIGLNVRRNHFSADLARTATSLHLALAPDPPPARTVLAATLLTELSQALCAISSTGEHRQLIDEIRTRDALRGRAITLLTPNGELHGTASGLDDEGALLLTLPDGSRSAITSAEHIRLT